MYKGPPGGSGVRPDGRATRFSGQSNDRLLGLLYGTTVASISSHMEKQGGAVYRSARSVVILILTLVALGEAPATGAAEAAECESRSMRVTFYTCAEGFSHCLTKQGHQPIPFRTVAVGDRSLLGRWLYVEDLGGWVLAADTGAALKKDSIDVFVGEGRMAVHATRLGVQHWNVRVCARARVASFGRAEPSRPTLLAAAPVP